MPKHDWEYEDQAERHLASLGIGDLYGDSRVRTAFTQLFAKNAKLEESLEELNERIDQAFGHMNMPSNR